MVGNGCATPFNVFLWNIPTNKPVFTPPARLTKPQKSIQDCILDIMELPIIKHSAFYHNTINTGKIDEMLSLRRAQDDSERTRIARPNMPLLNFAFDELQKVHTSCMACTMPSTRL